MLLAEARDALGTEDMLLEEAIDQAAEQVIAHVLPFPLADRFGDLVGVERAACASSCTA
jgi:hypothetical protein